MNFKIDENLPTELADDLRQLAHDADTVLGEGLRGAKDPAVVEAARASDRILFTPDKGIANVRRFPVMHPDVAEAQGFHQSVHDLVMRDGAVRCGSGRRRHEGQLLPRDELRVRVRDKRRFHSGISLFSNGIARAGSAERP